MYTRNFSKIDSPSKLSPFSSISQTYGDADVLLLVVPRYSHWSLSKIRFTWTVLCSFPVNRWFASNNLVSWRGCRGLEKLILRSFSMATNGDNANGFSQPCVRTQMPLDQLLLQKCCTLINDRIYRKLSKRNHGKGVPEFRIPIMIPAALFLSAGMFWYAWTTEVKIHWMMPNIGTSIFVAGALASTIRGFYQRLCHR